MCGIAGCLDWSADDVPEGRRERLGRMLRAVEHRGPDDWGMAFFGPAEGPPDGPADRVRTVASPVRLALGHRRLSVLDLSPRGRQPMFSRDATLAVTFNGEIYNYIELRDELARSGSTFETGTDTEVLLEAYRRWGVEMLPRLDGMFAFALWDSTRDQLVCARDPFGIKPFYYGVRDGRFVFGSEPRAVLAGLGTPGRVDRARAAEFLVFGFTDHDEGTFFEEVRQLPGGHWFVVDANGVGAPRRFWSPPEADLAPGEDAVARVRDEIDRAVHRQLRADVTVGGCLSGGLDSGSIVATASRQLGPRAADFTAFTIANRGFRGDESERARAAAQRAGVRWVGVEPDLEHLEEDVERLMRVQGEPFASLSIYAQYKVMESAHRHGVKVMLDGQGGDEVFVGYQRMAVRKVSEALARGRFRTALSEWLSLGRNASTSVARTLTSNVYFQSPRVVARYKTRALKPLMSHDWIRQARPRVVRDHYGTRGIRNLQVNELTRCPLPTLLRYEDRNSMAFAIEARVPMLSVGLVDLGLSLPWDHKVRNGWTKYALREAMSDRLPEEVVWQRSKLGFEVPQRRWVEAARPHIASWLAQLPPGCPIDREAVLQYIDSGHGGDGNMWRCLSFALWMLFEGVRT